CSGVFKAFELHLARRSRSGSRIVMATMAFLRHRGVMPFTFLAPLCPGHAAYGAEPVAHLWSVYVFLLPWICRRCAPLVSFASQVS
ncbi:hypothetical protein HaLaN_29205, partial [Haematococcus lacustris]